MKNKSKKYFKKMIEKANKDFNKEKNSWVFAEIIKHLKDK